jgi:uncharacterized protein YeaO (DUF488 family)
MIAPALHREEKDMELYTSHWRNQDLVHRNDLVAVGISRGVPRGELAKRLPYRYKRLVGLAPPSGLFERWKAGTVGQEEYTRVYRNHLDSLGLEEVVGQLEKKSAENGGKPLVLLCWCSTGEFCHRRVFADWYREKTSQEIPELAKALAA